LHLGKAIAQADCFLVTGGCPGLPLEAARGAKTVGGFVLGISPGLSEDEHLSKYRSPTDYHDVLVFTGSGLMGREVVNIRSSDIVVIAGGGSGTLGEIAIAYDEGKLIGILTGTGGISDMTKEILAACNKQTRCAGRLRRRPGKPGGDAPRDLSDGALSRAVMLLQRRRSNNGCAKGAGGPRRRGSER